ncbi:hypothetical protein SB48_HM08orf03837 [Heyndrickxia coagulans]|uniref:Uncharacterized protein n=1 Tax=Heyndrickxia coagulans TaxID=1398 RepID=A0AAN0T731_HEYCO|nr:hypothetical protein SB48_HM08orf03837 [Heyndrickxia coagulans]
MQLAVRTGIFPFLAFLLSYCKNVPFIQSKAPPFYPVNRKSSSIF